MIHNCDSSSGYVNSDRENTSMIDLIFFLSGFHIRSRILLLNAWLEISFWHCFSYISYQTLHLTFPSFIYLSPNSWLPEYSFFAYPVHMAISNRLPLLNLCCLYWYLVFTLFLVFSHWSNFVIFVNFNWYLPKIHLCCE